MKLFVVNVGANTALASARGLRSPVFRDGSFEFVPIPESKDFHGRDGILTYDDLPSWTGHASGLAAFIPSRVRTYSVHADPEFETFTYGDIATPRAANLARAEPGDQLWFLARLWDHDGSAWGGGSDFYFIGLIQVAENFLVSTGTAASHLTSERRERISRNAHYRRLAAGDSSGFRIIAGSMTSSRRFHVALRVTPDVAGHIYGGERGPDGLYRTSGTILLNKNGQPRRFEHLGSITRSIQAFLDSGISEHQVHVEPLARLAAAA
jgi:hypothetical protein